MPSTLNHSLLVFRAGVGLLQVRFKSLKDRQTATWDATPACKANGYCHRTVTSAAAWAVSGQQQCLLGISLGKKTPTHMLRRYAALLGCLQVLLLHRCLGHTCCWTAGKQAVRSGCFPHQPAYSSSKLSSRNAFVDQMQQGRAAAV